jgi:arylsulfatase A-like enzyme
MMATKMKTEKPNIVFVLTDDQGYGDLGCMGNEIIQTPHIDAFYDISVRLTDFHVGPTCAPTRAGLMTGHYANSTGVWHTIGGRSLLRKNEWSLADALKEAGYATGIFGKWHLGDEAPYRPQDRGFDEVVIHGGGGISQTPDHWGNDYFDDTYRVGEGLKKFSGYCTDVFFEEGIKFIEKNRDRPFICFLPTNAPHSPYNVDKKYSSPYKGKVPEPRDRFYGMISNIDENFGRLRARLQELDLEQNTILIFMTDNGSSCGTSIDEQGYVIEGYNAGFRGKKTSPYEGGHRVPFFIRWADGGIYGGRDLESVSANIDVMPTLLDLCSVNVPNHRHFHGKNLSPYLRGEIDLDNRTIVTDSQRVTNPIKWRQSAVIQKHWRLINGKELYDISLDREQRSDIAQKYPEVVKNLRKEYEKWWELVSTQFHEDIPLHIAPRKTTILNTHDWRNEDCSCAWNQAMIRKGMTCNGYYEIFVEQAGTYNVSLRRWPLETTHTITGSIDPKDDVEWNKDGVGNEDQEHYSGSTALKLNQAKLEIGNDLFEQAICEQSDSVNFTVHLRQGPGRLKSTFHGAEIELGAYYVVITPQSA